MALWMKLFLRNRPSKHNNWLSTNTEKAGQELLTGFFCVVYSLFEIFFCHSDEGGILMYPYI